MEARGGGDGGVRGGKPRLTERDEGLFFELALDFLHRPLVVELSGDFLLAMMRMHMLFRYRAMGGQSHWSSKDEGICPWYSGGLFAMMSDLDLSVRQAAIYSVP
jgi:hypothetical protein